MRYYELTYLISSNLSEEELKDLSQKINSFIQEEEGTLGEKSLPIKRKLARLIKNEGTAFLVNLNFYLNPEGLESLEKKLKSESQILRYAILTKKIPKKILEIEPAEAGERRRGWGSEKLPKKIIKPKEKVELKEIEKKLEEILEEP